MGDLHDPPARGAEGEHVVDARLVDHLLVELAHAGVLRLAGDEHAEQAAVGDRAAAGDRHPLSAGAPRESARVAVRSEEHTSELQSLMRISYAGFCLKKKT